MPKILIYRNFVFIIFSVDIHESRYHIHVVKKSVKRFNPAKFWLEPKIEMVVRGDFKDKELNTLNKLIAEHRDKIMKQLNDFYSGKNIKTIKI